MVGTFPPPISSPSLARTASSSSFSTSTQSESNGDLDDAPLVSQHDEKRRSRVSEMSLRQRNNTFLGPPSTLPNSDDDASLSDADSDMKMDKATSSILGSVMDLATSAGASSFLMGPHVFSSDLRSTPVRKDSTGLRSDSTDIEALDMDKRQTQSTAYRRSAPQAFAPNSSGTNLKSSFTEVDLENGDHDAEQGDFLFSGMTPSASNDLVTKKFSSPPSLRKRQHHNFQQSNYAFVLRTREQIIIHFLMELRMLRTDLLFVSFCVFYQFFHSAVTNIAYWQHARLSAAHRVPLRDIAYDFLPQVDGEWWIFSEYILYAILTISISCIVSNLVVRWNAPHGRPIYCMAIVRRMGLTLVVCQTLRMISFLATTLPGASRQCRYTVPEGLTTAEFLNGPAPTEGNPDGWGPPTTLSDILFRVDATNGCGDLMFSSHTIYTMTFVCIVYKYFNFKWLKRIMTFLQIAIVPFILASRKHYSIDVFTALYVTPLVFEILSIRFPDRDTSESLARHYGIRFYLAQEGQDSFSYVVSMFGKEYFVDHEELPVDLSDRGQRLMNNLSSWGKEVGESRTSAFVL